ncbi:hypothetical protein AWB81_08507 [Caballeronia arationis]|jgi:hypothetical protein|uniref:Uncharacterized protein n=1 Tax=Caballeronia arationis TaxID=1777142 RepID=A0A7Z7N141_9BURK|nr:hypothetical protein AWB81_08507 [Caballeronia arationis]SOE52954.1 hypothetical protein SAMN05446927_0569 [Caballeronia arationis]
MPTSPKGGRCPFHLDPLRPFDPARNQAQLLRYNCHSRSHAGRRVIGLMEGFV